MKQILVGVAGRKQAGKSTSYSCVRLWRPEAQEFAFADSLKRMAVDILGVEEWQVYGTDEQKNRIVPHLYWENFPLPAYSRNDGSVFIGYPNNIVSIRHGQDDPPKVWETLRKALEGKTPEDVIWQDVVWPDATHDGVELFQKTGPMTAREVLQYWGTEIFRKQYHNVWADACIRKIQKSQCQLAIITDCRFPNEVEAIQKAGGKVIKLTRVVFPNDNHPSETALDPENFNQNKFDAILDNAEMNVSEQCEALYALFRRWGIVDGKKVNRMHV